VKSLNSQLITYLATPSSLKELVTYLSDCRDDLGVVDSTGGEDVEGRRKESAGSMGESLVIVGKDEVEGGEEDGKKPDDGEVEEVDEADDAQKDDR